MDAIYFEICFLKYNYRMGTEGIGLGSDSVPSVNGLLREIYILTSKS